MRRGCFQRAKCDALRFQTSTSSAKWKSSTKTPARARARARLRLFSLISFASLMLHPLDKPRRECIARIRLHEIIKVACSTKATSARDRSRSASPRSPRVMSTFGLRILIRACRILIRSLGGSSEHNDYPDEADRDRKIVFARKGVFLSPRARTRERKRERETEILSLWLRYRFALLFQNVADSAEPPGCRARCEPAGRCESIRPFKRVATSSESGLWDEVAR